jgi:hypothetical protein
MQNYCTKKLKSRDVQIGALNKHVSIVKCNGEFFIKLDGTLWQIPAKYFELKTQPSILPGSEHQTPPLIYRYYLTELGYVYVDNTGYYQSSFRFINGSIRVVKHETLLLANDKMICSANLRCVHHNLVSPPRRINEYYIVCTFEDSVFYYKMFDTRVIIQTLRQFVSLEGFIALTIHRNGTIAFDDLNDILLKTIFVK